MRQGNNSRRSRGRGNGKRQPRGNHVDSHGPEVRVRGTGQQVYDKYLALARDYTVSGDRISAENMYQHAEHYFRTLPSAQESNEQRNENRDDPRSRHGRSGNEQSHEQGGPKANTSTEASAVDNKVTDPSDDAEVISESPVVAKDVAVKDRDETKVQDPSSQTEPDTEMPGEQVTI